MDSPYNCFSPFSATKASPNRKFSSDSHQSRPGNGANPEEIDENQQHTAGKDVALKPQFQKKPTKNFMSPTVSAASKVSAPRKKILAERNDCIPQPDDQSLPDSDSSSAPYDPLTNYLSPRPRFLRYNPNRRLQFLRTEKLKEELGLNGGSLSPESKIHNGGESSLPNDSGDSLAHEEQEEQEGRSHQLPEKVVSESCQEEEEEDEEGEEEDKRSWRGRSVTQYVFLLSLLFFGLHISSSAHPSSLLLSSQHLEGFDEGFLEIHDPLPFLRKSDLNNFCNQFFRLYKGLSTFVEGSAFSTFTFVSFTEERAFVAHPSVVTNDGILDMDIVSEFPDEETLSAANNDAEEVSHSCLPNDQVHSFQLDEQPSDDEISVVIPLGEELTVESGSSPLFESVLIGEASEFDDKVSVLIPLGGELIVESYSSPLFRSVQTGEASEFDNGHLVQQEEESMDVTEIGEDGGISEEDIDELEEAETEKEISSQGTEITEQTEMPDLSESPTLPFESASEPDLLPSSISVGSSMMESTTQIPKSTLKAMDARYSESYVRTMYGTEPNDQTSWTEFVKEEKLSLETALIVSLSLILAASITLVFLRLKAKKASEPTASSPSTTALEEKKITLECLEKEDNLGQDNSNINLSPAAQPLPADDLSPLYATRPPTVELLGEFELGEQVDSSWKDSSLHLRRTSQAKSVRVSETTEQENWRASVSFSSNKMKPSAQEFSTAESLSYGSFIVEGKLVKKQEGEAGISLVTTPVRRSSRIRNRVKSP